MAYQHNNTKGQNYYLHSKEVKLRSGKKQMIYFFAKEIKDGVLDQLPTGFIVVENKRTGLPVLKRGIV